MNLSTRAVSGVRLAFVDFQRLPDGSWSVLFEDGSEPLPLGSASTPRLALYSALDELGTRATGLERARAELERLEAERDQARLRAA